MHVCTTMRWNGLSPPLAPNPARSGATLACPASSTPLFRPTTVRGGGPNRTETNQTGKRQAKSGQSEETRVKSHQTSVKPWPGVNYCVHMQGTSAPLERRAFKGPLRSARRARCGPDLGGPEAPAWPVEPRRRSAGARPGSRSAAPVKPTPRARDLAAGAGELAVC